ncbi:hypothetical protein DFR87_01020 [Metallosphaera hakonensis JCM 8857 = DSM 7519]|uniref:Uncharacterized protein n=3 Tax=Metallosphaera hakonensis TaxID=79601 RepID=A0A2U9IWP0_9CREN|nr:hypothetical protein DFR87_01020 [Metallosphaera hakonensis JCM 8857 = DSM 7519]
MRWVHGSRGWKCDECYLAFTKGIQHENSLGCWKIGIPLSSLNVDLGDLLVLLEEMKVPWKFSRFAFPVSAMSRGILIIYTGSKDEMERVMGELGPLIRRVGSLERKFFDVFVNVEWKGGINYRRGCPEFDKFGDWRSWGKETH